jgi:hypothetical protein
VPAVFNRKFLGMAEYAAARRTADMDVKKVERIAL